MLVGDIDLLNGGDGVGLQVIGPFQDIIVRGQVIGERPGRIGHARGYLLHPFREELPGCGDLLGYPVGKIGENHPDHS